MRRILIHISIFCFLALTNCQILSCQLKPKVPFITPGCCPFEFGCNFHKWYVKSPVKAYRDEGDTTSFLFNVPAGDSLTFQYGDMYTLSLGTVILKRPWKEFTTNDTVYVLAYEGEGHYDVWYKDSIYYEEGFWYKDSTWGQPGLQIDPTEMSWWVRVQDAHHNFYWLRLRNTTQHGVDFGHDIEMVTKGFENY